MKIAVFGATGLTGRTFLKVCQENDVPHHIIHIYASQQSFGKTLSYGNVELKVRTTEQLSEHYDFLFGFCSSVVTKNLKNLWLNHSNIVIDNSSAFRLEDNVPLIVPEVNFESYHPSNRWIANPNCSTIQLVRVLYYLLPLSVQQIIVTTYQSVSGAGRAAMKEWEDQEAGEKKCQVFPEIIYQNVIPKIGELDKDGYTTEEMKLINETRKILNRDLLIIPTCVRVPVQIGHSEAVTIKFSQPIVYDQILQLLSNDRDIILRDERNGDRIPTPIEVSGTDKILVGRIRIHSKDPNYLSLWIVADNLRVGAATNAFRIFQKIKSIN